MTTKGNWITALLIDVHCSGSSHFTDKSNTSNEGGQDNSILQGLMRPNETIELMTKTKKSKTKNVKLLLRNQLTERNRLKLIQSHDNNNNNKKENTLQVLIIFLLRTFKRVT